MATTTRAILHEQWADHVGGTDSDTEFDDWIDAQLKPFYDEARNLDFEAIDWSLIHQRFRALCADTTIRRASQSYGRRPDNQFSAPTQRPPAAFVGTVRCRDLVRGGGSGRCCG
jgi:hypothetical protein